MESHIVAALTPELLAAACRPWALGSAGLRLIRDYENFVYEASGEGAGGRTVILRITHISHRRRSDLEAELAFVLSLADAGLPACRPLASRTGQLVEVIGDEFLACCFEHAAGTRMSWRDAAVWNPRTFRRWGMALAGFHLHAETYAPGPALRRQRWDEDDVTVARYLGEADADISERLEATVSRLRSRPAGPLEFGLIHGDLHPGNFFASPADGAISAFDFDDASYNWYSYDLAVAFYHLPDGEAEAPPRPPRQEVMQGILAGYSELRRLPDRLPDELAGFLLLRDLQMYQSHHKKVLPKDRQSGWFARTAILALRIRAGALPCELPR